jgi:ferredoxin, 2Fe-2S
MGYHEFRIGRTCFCFFLGHDFNRANATASRREARSLAQDKSAAADAVLGRRNKKFPLPRRGGTTIAACSTIAREKFMTEAAKKDIPPEKLVRVTFMPEGRTVEFEFGTMPYDHHGKPMSFLDVAENFGIFLDHACGGVCACTTCHLWIKDQAGISEADDDEIDRMDMAADQQLNSRLGCQAVITRPGNYVVEIPKWNRNYTSEGKPLALAEGK